MKQRLKNQRYLITLLFLISLTGCWSSNEIEEISLSVGLALDKGKESLIEKELREQDGSYSKSDHITLTYQFVNPHGTSSESESGGSNKAFVNISETGDSIHQMTREFSLRRGHPIYSPHLKVIVINHELVRQFSLKQLIDQFIRDNEIRPSCLVFISSGDASKTLESKEPGEIPSFNLLSIVDNEYRTTRISPALSLSKLAGKMEGQTSFLLQNIISSNGEVKFSGAAVIAGKTQKMIGLLNEEQVEGITWLTGKGKGGLVKVFDEKTGEPILYEIKSMKSKITPHVKGDKISFDVRIESEGRISENWMTLDNESDKEFIANTEKAVKDEVSRLVKDIVNIMQKEYKVDVGGFGNRLRIKQPKVWEKVKNDWDTIFSEVPITYNLNITITEFGASRSGK